MDARKRVLRATLAALLLLLLAPALGHAAQIKAGVGKADTTWHVGASSGQYASGCPDDVAANRCSFVGAHGVDPGAHGTRRTASYGVHSRLEARAIVIEGTDGRRYAIVKNDLYIPQDLLYRRVGLLLESEGSKVSRETLTLAATHNHSSPYYSSPSWGVWTFQDVGDLRFFEFYARQIVKAIKEAEAGLVPVRVGASVSQLPDLHRNVPGPATADDGTPAGYPQRFNDHDLAVVRFDDISGKKAKPLAVLVNYALHPEMLEGNDLISADYIGPFQRMVDRATGAMTIFVQHAVGSAEPDYERKANADVHKRLELYHRQYAQSEWGARLLADGVIENWRHVAGGPEPAGMTDRDRERFVAFRSDFAEREVAMVDRWYPGPFSHPYPGVANCRSDQNRVPVANNCMGPEDPLTPWTNEDFKALGIPVPDNYSVPSYTGLEEDVSVHLQALRLGEILMTICSCEQMADQSLNIKTRTDQQPGNEFIGYDRSDECSQRSDGAWNCPGADGPVPDDRYQRMRAQVRNPANGWNDAENAATAESEDPDPAKIKGNFTHDDDQRSAELGYKLTLAMSMANDYNGYIVSYREYQRGDHYRKSLAGWGAHSMDYMSTRLVTMARQLRDPAHPLPTDQQQESALAAKTAADLAKNDVEATALGEAGAARTAAEEAALPPDGPIAPVEEPKDIERFSTAFFTWHGGSNSTDDPSVRVERKVGDGWEPYADQSGEVPVTLEFPQVADAAEYLTGTHQWKWTAHFEAFASRFDTGTGDRATPPGTYRFVVHGAFRKRQPSGTVAREGYEMVSDPFEVRPWSGVTAEDVRVEDGGAVSFRVGPRSSVPFTTTGGAPATAEIGPIDYPDTYASPSRYIRNGRMFVRDPAAPDDPSRFEWYCLTCSFRPWADTGNAETASVTVVRDGRARQVPAVEQDGRWVTRYALQDGERAFVAPGCIRDQYGNVNGAASASVGDPAAGEVAGVDCLPRSAPPSSPSRPADPGPATELPAAGTHDHAAHGNAQSSPASAASILAAPVPVRSRSVSLRGLPRRLAVRRGVVSVPCRPAVAWVHGSVSVRAGGRTIASGSSRRAGSRAPVRAGLTRAGRRALAARRSRRATLAFTITGRDGRTYVARRSVVLVVR